MAMQAREFVDSEAVRGAVPLLIGLCGPSGGGKTFSALRLATGIQRVTGGDIHVIDTESRRALHYAGKGPGKFKFRHVPFVAPFGPLDYKAAIEHCVTKGARVVVIDSASHEHEGPGGVLEMHAEETQRRAKAWNQPEDKVQMGAWGPAKMQRRQLINAVTQLPISTIWCFRAKEKLKVIPGKPPKPMGWMPIAGEEFVFEFGIRCLLMPNADGVPTWQSKEEGENETIKRPGMFREILADRAQLCEDMGEAMARWSAGGDVAVLTIAAELLAAIPTADDAGLKSIGAKFKNAPKLSPFEVESIANAVKARRAELDAGAVSTTPAANDPPKTHDPASGEADPAEEAARGRDPGSDDV